MPILGFRRVGVCACVFKRVNINIYMCVCLCVCVGMPDWCTGVVTSDAQGCTLTGCQSLNISPND